MPSRIFHPPGLPVAQPSTKSAWVRDLSAGLSVAVVELPQSMAYAIIAGVPPVYGIYTAVIQGLIGSLLSGNRHVRTGATNTQSLLVAACMSQFGKLTPEEYLSLVAALTFLKGILQILAAMLRAGVLFRYVSPSTVVGLSAGAGLLIIAAQLPALLGLHVTGKSSLPGLLGMVSTSMTAASGSHAIDWRAVVLATGTIALMLLVSRIHKLLPAALIGASIATAITYFAGWATSAVPIATIGPIPHELPAFAKPHLPLERITPLFAGALALALLGMIEAVAISRSLRSPEDTATTNDLNRELWSQGLANFLSSFVGAIPGSASFSRSTLDVVAGAATRASGPIGAVFVAVLAYTLAPAAEFLPQAALAGILVVIAFRLFDVSFFLRASKNHRGDFIVAVVTLLSTVLLPLQFAVFIGVAANLVIQLRVASRLRVAELIPAAGGRFREADIGQAHNAHVRVIQIDGNLFFALRDDLDQLLLGLRNSTENQVVILRLRNTLSIDISIVEALAMFVQDMHSDGRHVILCGLSPHLYQPLSRDPRFAPGANDHPVLLQRRGDVFQSLTEAMTLARRITGKPIHEEADDGAAWVYVV